VCHEYTESNRLSVREKRVRFYFARCTVRRILKEETQMCSLSLKWSHFLLLLTFGYCFCRRYKRLLRISELYSSCIYNVSSAGLLHSEFNIAVSYNTLLSVDRRRRFLLWRPGKYPHGYSHVSHLTYNFPVVRQLFSDHVQLFWAGLQLRITDHAPSCRSLQRNTQLSFFILSIGGLYLVVLIIRNFFPSFFLSL
jgi:hypothetical protein